MDYRTQSNGSRTLAEFFWFVPVIVGGFLGASILNFFTQLNGTPWVCLLCIASTLLILGGSLIVYAKLPVYRSGRFFTFGLKSVPAHLTGYYHWGWRAFLVGTALSLCLLLSNLSNR